MQDKKQVLKKIVKDGKGGPVTDAVKKVGSTVEKFTGGKEVAKGIYEGAKSLLSGKKYKGPSAKDIAWDAGELALTLGGAGLVAKGAKALKGVKAAKGATKLAVKSAEDAAGKLGGRVGHVKSYSPGGTVFRDGKWIHEKKGVEMNLLDKKEHLKNILSSNKSSSRTVAGDIEKASKKQIADEIKDISRNTAFKAKRFPGEPRRSVLDRAYSDLYTEMGDYDEKMMGTRTQDFLKKSTKDFVKKALKKEKRWTASNKLKQNKTIALIRESRGRKATKNVIGERKTKANQPSHQLWEAPQLGD